MSTIQAQPAPRKQQHRAWLRRKMWQYKSIYLMIVPVFLYFAVFTFYPLGLGLVQSFQRVPLIGKATYNGIANYQQVLSDPIFIKSMTNSMLVGTVSLFINLAVALVLTISVNEVRNRFSKSLIQTATFLPYLFSWTVVGGMWLQILAHNGMVNNFLAMMGAQRLPFFTSPVWGRPVILFTNAWKQAGYFVVLMLASVVSIEPTIFEAARIDGASRFKQIRYIIIPQVWPTIKTLLVLGATGVLRNFDQVLIMNRPATKDSIRTLLLYIYEEGITKRRIGTATAAASVVMVITLVITVLVRRMARYDQDASY
ncbi:MAG TPA: sugar ABC transporter permease [Clostridiales bacterium]|jgi:putative aldouronate transport system permease protein|nr:sugar ABC transporter permease [Clostridiales bacterium]